MRALERCKYTNEATLPARLDADACVGDFEIGSKQMAQVANRVANAEWRTLAGDPVDAVTFCARCADLVVIGQLDPETCEADCVPTYFVQDVVLGAGKPVLIVPFAGHFGQVGGRAMVAWNASREASRAVRDALPLLKRSEAVELVSFDANKTPIDP